MKNEKAKFCPAMWLSGFFGLGAVIHLVRSVFGFGLVVAGRDIPVGTSVVLALVLGLLSVGLFVVSLKRPCDQKKTCCEH